MNGGSRSRRLPSPSIIVAIVALIAALAGSAIALPGKGSVDKSDIAKNAVTKKAIKKNAVTTKAIKDGAVSDVKLKNGAVTADKLAENAVGTGKIADNAVTTGKIADDAVTDAKVDGVVPAAFAYVNNSEQIVPEQSEGMGSATAVEDGTFICFYGLPFTPKTYQVTTVRVGGSLETASPNAFAPVDNTFCDGAEQASVQFFSDDGSAVASPPRFYITFFD